MGYTNNRDFMTKEEVEKYDLAILTSKNMLKDAGKYFASFDEEDIRKANVFKKHAETHQKTADDILRGAEIRHVEELNKKEAISCKLDLDKNNGYYKWILNGKPYTGVAYNYAMKSGEAGVGYYISIAALTDAVNRHSVIDTHWFRDGKKMYENISEIVIPFLQKNQWYTLSREYEHTFVFNIGIPTPIAFWAHPITMEAIEGSLEPVEDLETLLHKGRYEIDKFNM
jgi:hypothetical protein